MPRARRCRGCWSVASAPCHRDGSCRSRSRRRGCREGNQIAFGDHLARLSTRPSGVGTGGVAGGVHIQDREGLEPRTCHAQHEPCAIGGPIGEVVVRLIVRRHAAKPEPSGAMTAICEAPLVRSARRLLPRPNAIRSPRGDQAGPRGDPVALSNRTCQSEPSAFMTNILASAGRSGALIRLLLSVSTIWRPSATTRATSLFERAGTAGPC